MEKHFYLGANTPYGFYSYYDNLISQKSANKIYCIKGGPGTGKSTLMKTVANEMVKKGYDVEKIHCSSDDNSLDAIKINNLNIAFVDGTSPHIVDPKTPGAVDEIINLGAFWNENEIKKHKFSIIECNEKIKKSFNRAYNYLGAVRKIYDETELILSDSYSKYDAEKIFEAIVNKYFCEIPLSDRQGEKRKLFASAFTPSGIVSRLDTIFDGCKTYIIKGYAFDLLEKIADYACKRGINCEMYYCPMSPDKKCEHLVIGKLKLAFTLSNDYHSYNNGEVIEIGRNIGSTDIVTVQKNDEISKIIINMALSSIKEAKKIHDELETYYIKSMDFEKIHREQTKIINQILEIV